MGLDHYSNHASRIFELTHRTRKCWIGRLNNPELIDARGAPHVVAFSLDEAGATKVLEALLDVPHDEVTVTRFPHFDIYSDKGKISILALLRAGFGVDCKKCSKMVDIKSIAGSLIGSESLLCSTCCLRSVSAGHADAIDSRLSALPFQIKNHYPSTEVIFTYWSIPLCSAVGAVVFPGCFEPIDIQLTDMGTWRSYSTSRPNHERWEVYLGQLGEEHQKSLVGAV